MTGVEITTIGEDDPGTTIGVDDPGTTIGVEEAGMRLTGPELSGSSSHSSHS
jgi:hypothetical protein